MRPLGLRLQLVLALSVAFVVAFALLGVAAVQLGERGRIDARVDGARATASALARALERDDSGGAFQALAEAVLGQGSVRGVELVRATSREPWTRGVTGVGLRVEAHGEAGTVRLWLRAPGEELPTRSNLLLLYVVFTGCVILLLTYLVLTFLMVRPIEAVTRASERVAAGNLSVSLPARGAAEVARLASSFNEMAAQIRRDRGALEARLAELERTTRELEAAQEQVVRGARLASVGRLAAGLAHEIGNPLAAILGLVELARDDDVEEVDRAELLRRIQHETERIHGILRDLLDFARQGREPQDAAAQADLAEVVSDAAALVAPEAKGKLKIERALDATPPVVGSADRLVQVVLNLLLNAKDAMGGEGRVRVSARLEGGEAWLAIEDEGPGVAPEVLDRLFEPFVTTKPVGQGTGLGLAVSHTIVEQLGGRITVENLPERGARFVVHLPLASPRPGDRRESEPDDTPEARG
ncbi:MAG: HAMP domain-containing histidine kinase [Myxococcales bacterium]|nr:HAMP domain-containing histidine kinase [Myxococcales bacterium]